MRSDSQPLSLRSYPRAILHVDGDAFFTSVEQSIHPEWKGRPMVTGQERGIIACASYEAKALGIKRGVPLHEARKMCPELIVVPSDYETYSIYSKRMFDIIRRYTPIVEESSIDEGFADLTGLRRVHRTSYEEIARRIKEEIQRSLDLTVSVGLSLTKGLAKLCSKFRKPDGFTAVPGYRVHLLLQQTPLEEVWGFGPNTVNLLQKHGLKTAYDFAMKPEGWADKLLGKIGREIWHELRGESIYPVNPEEKSEYLTISKCKTFAAPSGDREYVYAKLVRNVESACIKLRRHRLRARAVCVALRRRDFSESAMEARLTRATSAPQEMLPIVREMFERLYEPGAEYRTTMVVLGEIETDWYVQYELFEDAVRAERMQRAARVIDAVNAWYGKHKLSLGSSLFLSRAPPSPRAVEPMRKTNLLPGETRRRRLNIPRLDIELK
ncbi:MAG: DNA polymerase IV [Kiritimatiellae bacterium]|nr:DNA polymerase IV [Kiritimatiellia bacterium]MDW8458959.1 DNA polymerase IV [Verrucomicrobiota bacterium]